MLGIPFLSSFVEKTVKRQTVADTVDHLNYYVTSYLLGFFAMAISAKQYFGSPIQCWVPSEFKGGWEKYAEDYCFIANSYHVPFSSELPEHGEGREDHISYYRWVPIVLAIQSVCFFLPNYFWNVMHKQTAINPRAFLREADKITELTGEKREEELKNLANFFMDTVGVFGDNNNRSNVLRTTPRNGKNAMILYLLTKALYVLNIYGQLVMLNNFLGESYIHWGYQSAWQIMLGNEWQDSVVFPRVIMCDFQIRRLGNIQNHTIQCVIMMNLINEKLFLFLYFWFLVLAIVTLANFFYYLIVMLVPSMRTRIVMVKLDERRKEESDHSRSRVERFVVECLHPDGVLLLQFLSEHSGGRIAYDLVNKLLAYHSAQEVGSYHSFSDDSIEKHPHSPMSFANPPSYRSQAKHFDHDSMEKGALFLPEKKSHPSSVSKPHRSHM